LLISHTYADAGEAPLDSSGFRDQRNLARKHLGGYIQHSRKMRCFRDFDGYAFKRTLIASKQIQVRIWVRFSCLAAGGAGPLICSG
jgi:hypothetical protein